MFPRPRSIIKFPDSARNRNPEEYKEHVNIHAHATWWMRPGGHRRRYPRAAAESGGFVPSKHVLPAGESG